MLVSMIAAIVAAVFYGVASVMQAIAVRAASNRQPEEAASGGVDPGLVVRMLHQWRFVASICLDALGFLAQLIALQKLPLFVVQAFVASRPMLATNRHWCSIRTTRPGSTPPEATSSGSRWLALRTAIACITEATP